MRLFLRQSNNFEMTNGTQLAANSGRSLVVVNPADRSFVCWTERGVLCLLIFFMCVHTLPKAWNGLVTDFPNYYLSARLAHDVYDTSRMYEWRWFEREKDHRAIEVPTIGLVPITPFSTLFMWPLTGIKPLAAKHIWILLNLLLLIPISRLFHSMTRLGYRRIALTLALSFPLYRNLEFGQFYVLLLFLIAAACWAYLRDHLALAGALIAIAAACKIFPVLFLVFFIQRRAWRALICGLVTGAGAVALSVLVFGLDVHRTYLQEILPWALHGEAMPPYVTNASFSGILHILFLSEPQWNPNPWHPSLFCYSLLLPTLEMLALAPAVLLIRREDRSPERVLLEWAALLTASLAISTIPASYNFVLMVLPMCILSAILLRRRRFAWLVVLLVIFIGIGFPVPDVSRASGLSLLLYVPRLPLMICMLLGIYRLLWSGWPAREALRDWSQFAWATVIVLDLALSARSTFLRERAERLEYAFRLPIQSQGLLNAEPQSVESGVDFLAFTFSGYHLMKSDQDGAPIGSGARSEEDLSFTSNRGQLWVERVENSRSTIINVTDHLTPHIEGARDPMLAADGRSLAFVRDDHGRGRLLVRTDLRPGPSAEVELTPQSMNVYEGAFLSEREYAFSAAADGNPPTLYLTDATHRNAPLALGESRYPALSPDGHWLAYSHFEEAAWNLWIRDQKTGMTHRIGEVPCNQIEPNWENDSKTLLYATDCGRGLWFTAVARRRVVP
jgi:Tol biopolymer transport system component